MRQISIQPIPSQEFTVNIGDFRYDFRIYLIEQGVMAYDLSIDEIYIWQGLRVTAGELMIPYRHQEVDGNFYISIPEGEDPDYNQFGLSQFLYYLNAGEVEQVRNGN